jgi:hydroxymethylbilane synthase
MQKQSLTIATRASPLALWQANWVKSCLEKIYPGIVIDLLSITTKADKMPYISLSEIGGKGLFVKELEESILDGRADIAVHCIKDMPVDLPPDLSLAVALAADEPWDVLVSNEYATFASLPKGAIVGTSSLRRQSLVLHWRPDLTVRGLRGNINTRLARLDQGEYDAIILAAAGLNRLDLQARVTQVFGREEFLPAMCQGVLGIECRTNDLPTRNLIAPLQDNLSFTRVTAERAMCRQLGGGCHVPVASFAEINNNNIILRGLVTSLDGVTLLQAQAENTLENAEILGIAVANDLLKQGAKKILAAAASLMVKKNE